MPHKGSTDQTLTSNPHLEVMGSSLIRNQMAEPEDSDYSFTLHSTCLSIGLEGHLYYVDSQTRSYLTPNTGARLEH